MALANGTHLGPYEIVGPLGTGGMGEVYRARDTRLDRAIAVKILPLHLAERPDLRERFEREARAVSALNHPNICTLYDIGQQDGIDYIVLELLEGQSLAERLIEGPLPINQVLRYSMEIADALDKAHRHGVIHRDLKPGNVMLTKSGSKLLDFGLAKVSAPAVFHPISGDDKPPSSTLTPDGLTVQGAMLGTLHYMSPEQLEGREADPRSDIFSLGLLIYEMASGRKTFQGKSQASVVAAILDRDPAPLTSVQPDAPVSLERVVRRCLEKDPDERWQSAKDLASELKWIAESGAAPAKPQSVQVSAPAPSLTRRDPIAWSLVGVLLISTLLFAFLYFRSRSAPATPPSFSFTVTTPQTNATSHIAISPDGTQLLYIAGASQGLSVRPLDSLNARSLPGTDGALHPFWSADSRFIGFFAAGGLKKISVSGGSAQTVTTVSGGSGGTWNRDGIIIFTDGKILYRVGSEGGEAKAISTLDTNANEIAHLAPYFLPDGRQFLYLARNADPAKSGVYVRSLDGEAKRLVEANSPAAYSSDGYLLFLRDDALVARNFDSKSRTVTGDAISIAERIQTNTLLNRAGFSVSDNGVLIYRNETNRNRRFIWFDRGGLPLESFGPTGVYGAWAMSPDEKRVAVEKVESINSSDLYLIDTPQGMLARFTFRSGVSVENNPVWSPDGTRLLFSLGPGNKTDIFQKVSSGAGQEEIFYKNEVGALASPEDISPDGRFLIYKIIGATATSDIWVMPMSGDRKPFAYMQTTFIETEPQVSPDGKWLAYASNESGRFEVYTQSFPEPGAKRQVSAGGGSSPKWRRDGRELFFITPDLKMMSTGIKDLGSLSMSAPQPLFDVRIPRSLIPSSLSRAQYYVSRDGQRFLVNTSEDDSVVPITVLINWISSLKLR